MADHGRQRSTDGVIIQMSGQLGALEEATRSAALDRTALWGKLDETNRTLREGFENLQTALQPLALLNQTVARHAVTLDKHEELIENQQKKLWMFSGVAGTLGITGGAVSATGGSKFLAWLTKVFGGGMSP